MLAARQQLFQKSAKQQKTVHPLICFPGKRHLLNAYIPGLTKETDLLVAVTPKSYVNTDNLEKYVDESLIPFIEQRREKMYMSNTPFTMLCDNQSPHVANEKVFICQSLRQKKSN
ncbi:MAG: hypothetical protein EZS28_021897 [Streblomastix strix]|uniref:DDE-1 domain-containing protein n=1 Tax=Streblomastix strix TaxID=222440 RepID=A0A5J4VJF8_9EUKA|nr:MAG: hypothetical protein EZS28_021897 [Streblomastix strix]